MCKPRWANTRGWRGTFQTSASSGATHRQNQGEHHDRGRCAVQKSKGDTPEGPWHQPNTRLKSSCVWEKLIPCNEHLTDKSEVARILGITSFFTDQMDSSPFQALAAEGQDTSWSTLAKFSWIKQISITYWWPHFVPPSLSIQQRKIHRCKPNAATGILKHLFLIRTGVSNTVLILLPMTY